MIRAGAVSYCYDEKISGLNNISFTIERQESVAIIGSNGSGKSTLLKLLGGLIFPTSGSYYFNNTHITEFYLKDPVRRKAFHKQIGFVFQNPDTQLFCPTVYEEIAFGPIQLNLSDSELQNRVRDCLMLLGIEQLAHRTPYTLSRGEKKKVAIAAALALNPDILILDEPLSELDTKSRTQVKELLVMLNKQYEKTIICATHEIHYFSDLFSRALLLSETHELAYDGSFTELIKNKQLLLEHGIQ